MEYIEPFIIPGWFILAGGFYWLYGFTEKKCKFYHIVLFFIFYPFVVDIVTKKIQSIERYKKDLVTDDDLNYKVINAVFKNYPVADLAVAYITGNNNNSY
jgi:hypothetical protein